MVLVYGGVNVAWQQATHFKIIEEKFAQVPIKCPTSHVSEQTLHIQMLLHIYNDSVDNIHQYPVNYNHVTVKACQKSDEIRM